MRRFPLRFALFTLLPVLLFLLVTASSARCQDPPDISQGVSAQQTYFGSQWEFIDAATGRVSLKIPLLPDQSQRGSLNFDYDLTYSDGGAWTEVCYWSDWSSWCGWQPASPPGSANTNLGVTPVMDQAFQFTMDGAGNYAAVDPSGAMHDLAGGYEGVNPVYCPSSSCTFESVDATGIHVGPCAGGFGCDPYYIPNAVTNNRGVSFVTNYTTGAFPMVIEDPNGNQMTMSPGGFFGMGQFGGVTSDYTTATSWTMTDTLGRTWSFGSAPDTDLCPPVEGVTYDYANFWITPGPSGSTRQYTFCYSMQSVSSTGLPNDGGVDYQYQYSWSGDMLSAAVLPDNTSWIFAYDSWGTISKVTLPTGGSITYTYNMVDGGGEPGPWGNEIRQLSQRVTPDGTWTYSSIEYSSPTVADPLGNTTTYYLGGANFPFRITHSTADGTILEVENKSYTPVMCTTMPVVTATTTSYPVPGSGTPSTYITSQITSSFASSTTGGCENPIGGWVYYYGPTGQTNYDFSVTPAAMPSDSGAYTDWLSYGSGTYTPTYMPTPGPALSTTSTSLYAFAFSSYLSPANLVSLPYQEKVFDGSGHLCSETDYAYDGTGLQSSGVSEQHNSTPPFSVRGNLSSTTRQLFISPCSSTTPSETGLPNTQTVYDTGMLYSSTDPKTNVTYYTHSTSSPYYGAYTTMVTNALSQSTTYGYDSNTGLMTSMEDPNSQTTTYSYDCMLRPATTTYPDAGADTWTATYSDSGSCTGGSLGRTYTGSTQTKKITSSLNYTTKEIDDSQGRKSVKELTSDPDGTDYTDTTYDADGRVHTVSNPCRSSSANSCGYTTNSYDGLNRITTLIEQDGSTVSTNYANFPCTTGTDEAGNDRKSCVDGMGRMTGVWENPSALNYQTSYAYDANSNLTLVTQNGNSSSLARVRTFTYDSLSQLTQASNPESGTTSYTYDANGNMHTHTDARGVLSTHYYDALNRTYQIDYSDGTPYVGMTYDSPVSGFPSTNTIGRLVNMWNGSVTSAIFSYDLMGRVADQWQWTPSLGCCVQLGYGYDLAGDITSATNGEGVTISYTIDGAMRQSGVTSSWADSGHPATLATVSSGVGYSPSGALLAMTMKYGSGLQTYTASYNNRLQPCRINLNSGNNIIDPASCPTSAVTDTIQDFQHGYNAGSSNNGNVVSWSGTGADPFNRSYDYTGTCTSTEHLNRLTCMSVSSGDPFCPTKWLYDSWGNRTDQIHTSGLCTDLSVLYADATNHITTGLCTSTCYDAAGNVINDGSHTYTYDAENRLTQVDDGSAAAYSYDANGHRVQKVAGGTTTGYLYDLSGNVVTEFVGDNTAWSGHVYFNGQELAKYESSATDFVFKDHLGSARVLTNMMAGSVCEIIDYMPFGEQAVSGSCDTSHRFTGKERDSESGLDNFGARYDSSQYGRFMTPDPENVSALMNLDDPQSWNGYAYVRNNPLNLTDPDGQNYTVCQYDDNGNKTNCADLTDKQYDEYRKSNTDVTATASGDLYAGDKKIGNASYYNEKDVAAAQQITSLGPPIEFLGEVEALAFFTVGARALEGSNPEMSLRGGSPYGTAGAVGNLKGASRQEADVILRAENPTKVHTTAGGYTEYRFADGSSIWLRPNGEVVRVPAPGTAGPGFRVGPDGGITNQHNTGEMLGRK
jgi:RHS repeat-associated protein